MKVKFKERVARKARPFLECGVWVNRELNEDLELSKIRIWNLVMERDIPKRQVWDYRLLYPEWARTQNPYPEQARTQNN